MANTSSAALPWTAEEQNELKDEIMRLFKSEHGQMNFYRTMTNDACLARHLILEPELLRKCLPLDNGQTIGSSPAGSLGALGRLSPEVSAMILTQMDLQTLTTFRSVSSTARATVDNLFQYRNVMKHAPQILRATLALKAAEYITLKHLDTALMSNACQDCGEFGAYLHVPTCERVCYRCFTKNQERKPLTLTSAKYKWCLTKSDFENVKKNTISTIPGRYKVRGRIETSRQTYMSNEEALRARLHISAESREECLRLFEAHNKRKMDNYLARIAANFKTPRPSYTPNPSPKAQPEECRFQVVVGMPWVSARSKDAVVEWGVSCTGCRNHKPTKAEKRTLVGREIQLNQVKLYSKSGFIDHVMVCPYAQALYEKSRRRIHNLNVLCPVTTSHECAVAGEVETHVSVVGQNLSIPCWNYLYLRRVPVESI